MNLGRNFDFPHIDNTLVFTEWSPIIGNSNLITSAVEQVLNYLRNLKNVIVPNEPTVELFYAGSRLSRKLHTFVQFKLNSPQLYIRAIVTESIDYNSKSLPVISEFFAASSPLTNSL